MRRAQDRMRLARPYAQKMRNVIGHLTEANPDYKHPFLHERDVKSIGIVVISTDRGLAGGLNANTFKQTLQLMREWQGKGATRESCRDRPKGAGLLPTPREREDPGERCRSGRSSPSRISSAP